VRTSITWCGAGSGDGQARGGGSHWANQEEGAGNNQWLPGVSAALHLRPAIFFSPVFQDAFTRGQGTGQQWLCELG
jgi:hypothetical protein